MAPRAALGPAPALLEARGLGKRFGAVQALRGASLALARGESVGIVGHNGAGKSTLMNILGGTLAPDSGELHVGGRPVGGHWDAREAQRLGVRRVFQELSLCPNLTLAENLHVAQPAGRGRGWRRRAGEQLLATLDRIFPGHGMRPDQVVADLPIGQRQAVEIARAFTPGDGADFDVMILDEPTSSLDGQAADQLLAFIRSFVAEGRTCVLISHKLREIFAVTDRVVVMRDGQVVDTAATRDTDRRRLVAAMGQDEAVRDVAGGAPGRGGIWAASTAEVVVQARADPRDRVVLQARRGEVIGLAGLAGHGQTRMLVRLRADPSSRSFSLRERPASGSVSLRERIGVQVADERSPAFIPGDRQTDGVFPLWSIARNMSLGWFAGLCRRGLIDLGRERGQVQRWRTRLALVTPDVRLPILSLSGGNQQKVLFARALGGPAQVVLMDDPMRGVDVGTKHDVYELIRAEAAAGRTFVWYTTEFDELHHCDRIYVFNNDRIVGELARDELSEEKVLGMSFDEAA